MTIDDEDDDLVLSSATQAALAEFLAERQAKESEPTAQQEKDSIDSFPEDWQLSQFWYDDETAETLAKELLHDATAETVIAIISAPSVYAKIKKLRCPTEKIYLFEYDSRFSRLVTTPDTFINYDYNIPLRFPAMLRGKVDCILADPPFLSDECLTRTAITVRTLLKKDVGRTMVCTGRKMEDMVPKLFPGVRKVEFEPKHKGGLANAFGCFMNWEGTYV